MMTDFLENARTSDHGFLCLDENDTDDDKTLLVLESAEMLWRLFHPHCTSLDLQDTTEPKPLDELTQYKNLANTVLPVLDDIDKMQDRKRDLTKQERLERERLMEAKRKQQEGEKNAQGRQKNVESLERHAAALQRGSSSETTEIVGDFAQATVRIVKALNSIRLVFPVLIAMLNHPERQNGDLEIGKVRLKNKGGQRWFLGNFIFDCGSIKNHNMVHSRIETILDAFCPRSVVESIMTNTVPPHQLLPLLLSHSQPPSDNNNNSENLRFNPLQSLLSSKEEQEVDKERVLETAQRHDRSFLERLNADRDHGDAKQQYNMAVEKLIAELERALCGRFRGATLRVYGSCLSDLSLGKSSDVDLSLAIPRLNEAKRLYETNRLPATKYEQERKRTIYAVHARLGRDFGKSFVETVAVARARVPVIKGRFLHAENPYTSDGSLMFDLCFFNDIAVTNSALLREYTLVSERSKQFLLTVKKWAKNNHVSSAADDRLSSYAWMNFAIYYLQTIGLLPNLQSRDLMEKVGFRMDQSGNPAHFVSALDTAFMSWQEVWMSKAWQPQEDVVDLPLSVLLYGFFDFYVVRFPRSLYAASIKLGKEVRIPKSMFRKACLSFYCVEDPFETHNSYCPHDLGSHASERGKEIIAQLMHDTRDYLQQVLLGDRDGDEDAPEGEFWPPPAAPPEEAQKNKKKKGNDSEQHRMARKAKERHRQAGRKGQKPPPASKKASTSTPPPEEAKAGRQGKSKGDEKKEDSQSAAKTGNGRRRKQNGNNKPQKGGKKGPPHARKKGPNNNNKPKKGGEQRPQEEAKPTDDKLSNVQETNRINPVGS